MISPSGFWIGKQAGRHYFDRPLADSLSQLFAGQSVADFGCGQGDYVRWFLSRGINCDGFDGNPETPNYCLSAEVLDLSEPQTFLRPWDWVLSLEVGEHIPPQKADVFLWNVVLHARRGVVISWAIPGQGGIGHVNEQPNKFVIDFFKSHGFSSDHLWIVLLREAASVWWFKESLMVFRAT